MGSGIILNNFDNNQIIKKQISKETLENFLNKFPDFTEFTFEEFYEYFAEKTKIFNDLEKCWLIFKWISNNISYDYEAFLTQKFSDQTAETVFYQRKAICTGFSALFTVLSNYLNLKSVLIEGIVKGFNYDPQNYVINANHIWNAVLIYGKWRLIDVTWGTGFLDSKGNYVKEFDEFYFLSDPNKLIRSHYPENKKWQLLEKQVEYEEFNKLLKLTGIFYKNGFEKIVPDLSIIKIDQNYDISILFSPLQKQEIQYKLIKVKDYLKTEIRNKIFIQKYPGYYKILISNIQKGKYQLQFFITDHSKDCSLLFEYKLISENLSNSSNIIEYPEQFINYNLFNCNLIRPMQFQLNFGEIYNFEFKFPINSEILFAIVIGPNWYFIKPIESSFNKIYKKLLEIDGNYVGIYAKNEKFSTKFATLLEYKIAKFPESYSCVRRNIETIYKNGIYNFPKNANITISDTIFNINFNIDETKCAKILTKILNSEKNIGFYAKSIISKNSVQIIINLPSKGQYCCQIFAKNHNEIYAQYDFCLEYFINFY